MLNFKFILKAIISILLLFYIVHDVEFAKIIEAIESANHLILVGAFSLHFLGLLISSVRWQILLKAQKITIHIKDLYKSYLVASFFNHFLPSTVGGDSIRAYDSWKAGENKEKALAVVVLDRFMGLLTLLIFAVVSMLFSQDLGDKISGLTFWIIILTIGAAGIVWFILFPPIKFLATLTRKFKGILSKVVGFIYKIAVVFNQFSNYKRELFNAFLLSVVLQLNVVLYYFLISESLNLNITIIDYFLIVPLTIFITMLPISFNGVGLRENALFVFLSPFGIVQFQAIAFAWIEYSMLLILGIIGGLVYSFRKST